MPWKFILFILCMIVAAVFTGFNLQNSCDIDFGFKRFEQVPVFLTILFSFLAGILITLPFTLIRKRGPHTEKPAKPLPVKKGKKDKSSEKTPTGDEAVLFVDESDKTTGRLFSAKNKHI